MRQQIAVWAVAAGMMSMGCGGPNRQVKRLATDTRTDLSGRWNDTDARETSEALIGQCLAAPWLERFKRQEDRLPSLRVRRIVNKTDEHIDAQVFVKNIERALINSGEAEILAQEGSELASVHDEQDYGVSGRVDEGPSVGNEQGGDFVLVGRLAAVMDQIEGQRATLYKITFELIDATTSKKVWIGDHEIKKLVSQKSLSW